MALNTSVSASVYSKGQQGKYTKERWNNLIYPDTTISHEVDETRSQEEIIEFMKNKINQ